MKSEKFEKIKKWLREYDGPRVRIMEVCGSHTRAIAKNGIPGMLSPRIELLSGPGCPVCVTPSAYIDRLVELSMAPGVTVVSFGDLIRVPGSERSLSEAKGEGGSVEMVYAPTDALRLARERPGRDFVFAAVGFETTAPAHAELARRIREEGITNLKLLTAIKTMPPVIAHLLEGGAAIDGFLAPGHVSVITGAAAFEPLAERYGVPFVVAGFTGARLLVAIYDLIQNRGRGVVKNDYPSVVSDEGNPAARALMEEFFEPATAVWRGMGPIPGSGLLLRPDCAALDAGSSGLDADVKKNAACVCDKVLMGEKKPSDCPLFGTVCAPTHPQGACMVSSEGSCFSFYESGRER